MGLERGDAQGVQDADHDHTGRQRRRPAVAKVAPVHIIGNDPKMNPSLLMMSNTIDSRPGPVPNRTVVATTAGMAMLWGTSVPSHGISAHRNAVAAITKMSPSPYRQTAGSDQSRYGVNSRTSRSSQPIEGRNQRL